MNQAKQVKPALPLAELKKKYNMHLGEVIETIINNRTDGEFGFYCGATAKTFGACRIDGVVYKVERNIEVDNDEPFWTVRNVNTGKVAIAQDKYDLGCIKETDFK